MSERAVNRSTHLPVSTIYLLSLAVRASRMKDSEPLRPRPKNRLALMGVSPAFLPSGSNGC